MFSMPEVLQRTSPFKPSLDKQLADQIGRRLREFAEYPVTITQVMIVRADADVLELADLGGYYLREVLASARTAQQIEHRNWSITMADHGAFVELMIEDANDPAVCLTFLERAPHGRNMELDELLLELEHLARRVRRPAALT
jgi:hypothetical protein